MPVSESRRAGQRATPYYGCSSRAAVAGGTKGLEDKTPARGLSGFTTGLSRVPDRYYVRRYATRSGACGTRHCDGSRK